MIPRERGLTLIEVLVALSIVAITLTAGLQATGALTRLAERQSSQWLAQLCADNALTALRLAPQMPAIGRVEIPCEQAGRNFRVVVETSPTPNPSFRRVQAHVEAESGAGQPAGTALLHLSTVIGRY
jgi:general secretion pathway protein I